MNEIASFYHVKGEVSTTYKVKRKKAFLDVAEMNAAFQRLSQDPKSKQVELSTIYEITVFNNTFLSSLAALGAYFRNNKTSIVPKEFDVYVDKICGNIKIAISILEDTDILHKSTEISIEDAKISYEKAFNELSDKRDFEIEQGEEHSIKTGSQLKETLLVSEQLKWLYKLSENLIESVKKYKKNSL